MTSGQVSAKAASIERLCLNVLDRRRLRRIPLASCMEETGLRFGSNGTHFFISALRAGPDREAVGAYLADYYQQVPFPCFDEILGYESGSPIGKMYFTPWEDGRVRPLTKFLGSARGGPITSDALDKVLDRLFVILQKVQMQGFRQLSILDGIPRFYELVDVDNCSHYVIRDGQHRAAIASFIGISSMLACYEAVHFKRSPVYHVAKYLAGLPAAETARYLSIVRRDEVDSWPHVVSGDVSRSVAEDFFDAVVAGRYYRQFGIDADAS